MYKPLFLPLNFCSLSTMKALYPEKRMLPYNKLILYDIVKEKNRQHPLLDV